MNRDGLCHAIRERLKRLPPPFEAHYGVVPPPPPEDAVSVVPLQTRHSGANAALARVETLAGELADPYLISRILPRREAVSSSAMEGTNSTLDELLSIEEIAEDGASDAAVQVRDYALTLDTLVPRARSEGHAIFTSGLARELHCAVMRGDTQYQDVPGELRSRVVWIGGGDIAYSTYNSAPPDDIAATLEDAMHYMRCEGMQPMQQSLVTRMAIGHAHFEAVHPFQDGNGRVGRLLLPLMMAAEGHMPLYLSPYIEAHNFDYYEALKAAQQRLEWHEIIGFMSDAIAGTVSELLVTRDGLVSLRDRWRARRKFRKGSAALRALDVLPHYPVLTINRLADLLEVTFPAASAAIDRLVDAEVLRERTGYTRNRIFVAPEALLVINRPFGVVPVLPRK